MRDEYSKNYTEDVIRPYPDDMQPRPDLEHLMPASHFSIWFRHHLRTRGHSYAEYAERVGDAETRIRSIAEHGKYPTNSILQDLRLLKVTIDEDVYFRSY